MQTHCRHQLCVITLCLILTGCAQSNFHASELPARYAARPIRDYSMLNLTQLTSVSPNADTILEGDRLKVRLDPGTLLDDSEHVWTVSVDESGQTSLPNIGPVRLAGLTRTEAEQAITQASLQRQVFLTPTVEVSVEDRREQFILVTGAVNKPGPLAVRSDDLTLADVIVRAGGLTKKSSGVISVSSAKVQKLSSPGSGNMIQSVSMGVPRPMTISLASSSPEDLGKTMIPIGAVVNVEESPPRPIRVIGVIKNQGIEIPAGEDVRLLDAIAVAGGQTYSNWISDRVTVIRTMPDSKETVRIAASIRGAKNNGKENILLSPQDIISVEENIFTFTLSTISGFLGAGFNASRLAL